MEGGEQDRNQEKSVSTKALKQRDGGELEEVHEVEDK